MSDACRTCGQEIKVSIYKGTGACGSIHKQEQERAAVSAPEPAEPALGSTDLGNAVEAGSEPHGAHATPVEPVRSEPECSVPEEAKPSPLDEARWAAQRAKAARDRGDMGAAAMAEAEYERHRAAATKAGIA